MDQKKNEQCKTDQVDSSGRTKNTSTQTTLTGRHPETTLRQAATEYLQARIAYDREQLYRRWAEVARVDLRPRQRRAIRQSGSIEDLLLFSELVMTNMQIIGDLEPRRESQRGMYRRCQSQTSTVWKTIDTSEIDDEIQKLMCFLPKRRPGPQKLSRNQILKELYEVALEELKDEHVKKPDTEKHSTSGQPSSLAQSSTLEQVSISEQPSTSDVKKASSKWFSPEESC
ncbi:hypothetical protein GCK72_006057 [Caenorhabditis remanei]|uniref:Uncharacterized protein n=1 Tax=Caenorhabditis remanei TaxID=31234 RepID=A0A6A5HGD0_CAERE|nr:hypothetical protein GCK72_006057 [Caenorhabditis remanei]KAF1766101.1 hypothetical protein GCK72_006057 [Caenorhabditis remanei]